MFFELETDYALNATSTRFGHIEMKILYIRMNFSKHELLSIVSL